MGKQFHKGFRTARYKPDGGLEAGERDRDGQNQLIRPR